MSVAERFPADIVTGGKGLTRAKVNELSSSPSLEEEELSAEGEDLDGASEEL